MTDLVNRNALDLLQGMENGECSASEMMDAVFSRIHHVDPKIRAFISLREEEARAEGKAIDEKRARGESVGRLAGLPVAVKDNINVQGTRTTCGSKILENYCSPYNAHVITPLKEEGAIIVGKTNLDEFAMGSSCENSAFFPTRNPWDPEKIPGGSSGGSAAAVSARMVPLAIGSDTGGSIRQPAALTGTVGFKPTYGRVSRYGLVAFASSLDQIGPFGRTVGDVALLMDCLSGHDGRDSTSADVDSTACLDGLEGQVKGTKVGLPRQFFGDGVDPEIQKSVRDVVGLLEKNGVEMTEVDLPHTPYAIACYYIIAPSEASANLSRFDGVRYGYRCAEAVDVMDLYTRSRSEGFGPEVQRRIMIGAFALSSGYYDAYYLRAMKVRRKIKEDFDRAFEKVDLILGPTSPIAAFDLGAKTEDPLAMYLCDIFTVSANLAGLPALSMPCGLTPDRLPVGLHLIGPAFDDEGLFRFARFYEKLRGDFPAPDLVTDHE